MYITYLNNKYQIFSIVNRLLLLWCNNSQPIIIIIIIIIAAHFLSKFVNNFALNIFCKSIHLGGLSALDLCLTSFKGLMETLDASGKWFFVI